jgi:hypothetical protein
MGSAISRQSIFSPRFLLNLLGRRRLRAATSCTYTTSSHHLVQIVAIQRKEGVLTNPHHNQEPRTKPPEINDRIPRTLHEIIGVRASLANPIGQWGEDVCRHDEEGEVVVEEGRGEDYEEETYC